MISLQNYENKTKLNVVDIKIYSYCDWLLRILMTSVQEHNKIQFLEHVCAETLGSGNHNGGVLARGTALAWLQLGIQNVLTGKCSFTQCTHL